MKIQNFKDWLGESVHKESTELDDRDFKSLEKFADDYFEELGFDVVFTKHFKDQVNNSRNGAQVTYDELETLLLKTFNAAGHKIAKLPDDGEAVLKQLATWLNVPIKVIGEPSSEERDLVLKTIMRKKHFNTPNQEINI
jgi:hypothetical protein